MLFLTYWFVLFVCVVYPLYWFVRNPTARLLLLLASSAVFHTHFAGPAGVLPILLLGGLVYLAGLSRNRAACVAGVVLSAASLVFYKYTKFICLEILGAVAPSLAPSMLESVKPVLPDLPPLAISFFVFEFVHYLVEVLRGGPSIRSPLKFAMFAVFWPSIVAGPVKRYGDFLADLDDGTRNVDRQDVAVGVTRVAVGLLKKMAADNLTAFLTFYGSRFGELSLTWRWLFVLFIGLRILWDFSGYSDMAVGFARMHGIRLPENFNWPYLATNVAGFWHRWHMSLSLWIRDYVYIALGGGRCGTPRKIANGLLAFGICGLWHGAGWNFLVWGLYHGVGLALGSNYRALLGRPGRSLGDWFDHNRVVAWLLTMLFVFVGWLFFFYPLPVALDMIRLLFGGRRS